MRNRVEGISGSMEQAIIRVTVASLLPRAIQPPGGVRSGREDATEPRGEKPGPTGHDASALGSTATGRMRQRRLGGATMGAGSSAEPEHERWESAGGERSGVGEMWCRWREVVGPLVGTGGF